MITKYKTTGLEFRIDIVDCERETAKSVWIRGKRFAKYGNRFRYWSSWEGAQAYLVHERSWNATRDELLHGIENEISRRIPK